MKLITKITFVLLLLPFSVMAQQMSVSSFEAEPNDMDARVHYSRKDLNGQQAALIKVESTLKGFAFDVGSLGVIDVDHTQVGETWLWVPRGVINLVIKHNNFNVLRYEFPVAIECAVVYRLKISADNVKMIIEQTAGGQYLIVNTNPADVEIIIDDGSPISITGGEGNLFLPYGEHNYLVRSKLYKSIEGTIKIGDKKESLNIALEPNFGYINVSSTPVGADVEVNGVAVGQTPYRSPKIELGEYNVRITANNFAPHLQSVNLKEGERAVNIDHSLISYMSQVSVSCPMSEASIYINGIERGKGSWSGELLPGTYELRAEIDGHRPSVRSLIVDQSSSYNIVADAPTPMYGTLNVSSEQNGVSVSIDDKLLGEAPDVFTNIIVGEHTLKLSKDGYEDVVSTIEINEGKVTQYRQAELKDIGLLSGQTVPKWFISPESGVYVGVSAPSENILERENGAIITALMSYYFTLPLDMKVGAGGQSPDAVEMSMVSDEEKTFSTSESQTYSKPIDFEIIRDFTNNRGEYYVAIRIKYIEEELDKVFSDIYIMSKESSNKNNNYDFKSFTEYSYMDKYILFMKNNVREQENIYESERLVNNLLVYQSISEGGVYVNKINNGYQYNNTYDGDRDVLYNKVPSLKPKKPTKGEIKIGNDNFAVQCNNSIGYAYIEALENIKSLNKYKGYDNAHPILIPEFNIIDNMLVVIFK